jgi:hypothetical protein
MTTSNDPVLYRIMDFFEFVALANSGTLRVSSATRFSDVNELLGVFLSNLDNPGSHPYTEKEMAERITQFHGYKQSAFISSWTESRDSIAMWELYSSDARSIQIGVRKSVIEAAFSSHSRQNSYGQAHKAPSDDGRILFYPEESGVCEYVNFEEIFASLRDRYENFYGKEASERFADNDFGDDYEAANKEFFTKRSIDFQQVLFFKDRAYSHEREYRFTLLAVTRNSRPYEECKKDKMFGLFDTHLRPVKSTDSGKNIFIPFDITCIEGLWLDGRTPPWKQEILKVLLADYPLVPKLSQAYGSFFEFNEIKPMN